eukprot:Pgem_evm1s6698
MKVAAVSSVLLLASVALFGFADGYGYNHGGGGGGYGKVCEPGLGRCECRQADGVRCCGTVYEGSDRRRSRLESKNGNSGCGCTWSNRCWNDGWAPYESCWEWGYNKHSSCGGYG